MTDLLSDAVAFYEDHFKDVPAVAAYAPGRVEILGNHTDYNGGYVMSAAIDRGTVLVGSPSDDGEISLLAADLERTARFEAASFVKEHNDAWANYVLGVVQQLQHTGVDIRGFQAAIHSNVPIGAGLSSSAAMEVATAYLVKQIYPYTLDKMDIALLCQKAENRFVGVSSGLLDQFSSVFGAPDHILFLDCVTHEHEQIGLPRTDLCLVICDSLVKHSLVGGDYNTRRAECEAAAAFFGKALLRDVSIKEFEEKQSELPENQRKRAQHIIEENGRVLAARSALKIGDANMLGALMSQSHDSSRYLFENSTPELDFLVDTARSLPGCLGCKLNGGGWGGATVNLVDQEHVAAFKSELASRYLAYSGRIAPVFVSAISNGAHELTV